MRSSPATSFANASRLVVCLGVAFTLSLVAAGCGGDSGSGTGTTTTTVTSVTVSPSSATVTAGASQQFSAVVEGQDSPSQVVAWSVNPASAGTIDTTGKFISSSSITATTTATVVAASTVPGYTSITGSATATINPIPAPTVTLSADPTSITSGGSSTLTVATTNATTVTWTAGLSGSAPSNGSVSVSPAATTTYTVSASNAAGSATASATVTVTATVPNMDSDTPNITYSDNLFDATIQITGSNLENASVFTDGILFGNSALTEITSPTEATMFASFGTPQYSPGFWTIVACENSNQTGCGTSVLNAFLGARNYLAVASNGEVFSLDQAQGAAAGQNGYVRKYKADGTADGDFFVGALAYADAVDNTTGNVLIDEGDFDESGNMSSVATPTGFPSQSPDSPVGVAADNGYGGVTQPATNSVSFYDMTGGVGTVNVVTASNLGNYPEAIAMGTFGPETDAFVVSVNDSPAPLLHKVRASDAYTGEEPAFPLPGCTPMSAVQAANPVAGGWQVVVFDSGPASGTVAVLCAYDKTLDLVNVGMWTVKSVTLSGVPFRIAPDATHGNVIVAYVDLANARTTYDSVAALTGTVNPPLTSTSSLLSVGLAVSSDGTKIYSAQRDQLQVLSNQ